jgi:capsular exopolysaccharide synthesis family protein
MEPTKSTVEYTESINLDFQKYWSILKRRWLPAVSVFSGVVGLAIVVVLLQKPVYQAEGKLLLKKVDRASDATGLGERIGELDTLAQQANPLKTETEVLRSIPLVQKAITELNLQDEAGVPLEPEDFIEKLKVKQLSATDVLQLTYKSTDPEEAAAVVNKLMELYTESNILNNRDEAIAAVEFIAKQLPRTEATVRQAEAALRQFKEQNHVVNLDQEAKSALEVIQQLENQINQTQTALAGANARYADLHQKVRMSSEEAIATNSLNQSSGIQKALEELRQIEDQLAVQRTRLQEDHPTIVNLKLKETALRFQLQGRVEAAGVLQPVPNAQLQIGESKQKLNEALVKLEEERSGLTSQLAKLSSAQATYKQRINILPKLEQEQRELERRLAAAQSTYETLLKKIQEVRVAANQRIANARIMEPAPIPKKPSLLKPAIILALGNMLGILLAAATIVILEIKDTSIKTLEEALELFGYTLLGVIPALNKKAIPRGRDKEWTVPELPVRDTPNLPISEAYRMLQANLKFLSSDKALKVIVVTSAVSKEGKSTVSANLAAAIAQLERRVLLVDADMRRPVQHHIWELTNAVGLSDVIVGQAESKAAVTQVMPNLDVLTSGVIPPNPLALLDSKRMASLIEYFSARYDFVIIDAPPLVIAADALTLGKMADGVLLVTRPGVGNSTSAATAKHSLERSCQNVLGLVVNDVELENEHYAKEYYVEEDSITRKPSTASRKVL